MTYNVFGGTLNLAQSINLGCVRYETDTSINLKFSAVMINMDAVVLV